MLDPHVVDCLRAPFDGRLAGLVQVLSTTTHTPTLDGCTVTAGEVIDFGHDFVHMLQAPFVPMRGFDLASKDCRSCIIRVPQATERSISLCRGGRVVIAGPLNSVKVDGEICFDSKAVVIHRPELQTDLTWTVVHAFSGVFGGWKQAIHWLSKKGSSAIFGRHISVDASEEVMRVWEAKHEKKAFCAPLLPTLSHASWTWGFGESLSVSLWDGPRINGILCCASLTWVSPSHALLNHISAPSCVLQSRAWLPSAPISAVSLASHRMSWRSLSHLLLLAVVQVSSSLSFFRPTLALAYGHASLTLSKIELSLSSWAEHSTPSPRLASAWTHLTSKGSRTACSCKLHQHLPSRQEGTTSPKAPRLPSQPKQPSPKGQSLPPIPTDGLQPMRWSSQHSCSNGPRLLGPSTHHQSIGTCLNLNLKMDPSGP